MANPNPGPLSKWLFIITMVSAVAYIGAAFGYVILADPEGGNSKPAQTAVDSPAKEAPKAGKESTP